MRAGLLVLAVGCSGAAPPAAPRALTVLAASSLTGAFTDLAREFEAAHPGARVTLSFAGSQALAAQIRHGIAADVYASADSDLTAALAAEGLLATPRDFAGNRLVLAVPDGATAPTSLADLPSAGTLVVGADAAPVGRYTADLLAAAGTRYGPDWRAAVEARVASREPNVRLVAAKVALGEADAAIVYATDVVGLDGVHGVSLPADLAPTARYVHGRLAAAPAPRLAEDWLAHVDSDAGQAVLVAAGFTPAAP